MDDPRSISERIRVAGYGHRPNPRGTGGRVVFRLHDGVVIATLRAHAALEYCEANPVLPSPLKEKEAA